MRLAWKLALIVLLTVAIQVAVGPCADEMEEVAFTVRMGFSALLGQPASTPELVDDALRMMDRQNKRLLKRRAAATTSPSTQPAESPDAPDL